MSTGSYITVPTLSKWQHYKDRCPPWIKLHRDVLNDYHFSCLQDASKAHLLSIWLLASQLDNKVPNDPVWIARRINATESVDLKELEASGFIEVMDNDSIPLASCKQKAVAETETETETELPIQGRRRIYEDEDGKFYDADTGELILDGEANPFDYNHGGHHA